MGYLITVSAQLQYIIGGPFTFGKYYSLVFYFYRHENI